MLGRTHAAAGLCTGAALTLTRDLPVATAILVTAQTFVGALLPDIDQRNSTISQAVRPVGLVVSAVAGHRKLLHDPVLYTLLFGFLWICRQEVALFWLPLFAGIATHLLLDACNPTGIPVVYPVRKWRLRLLRLHTGGFPDRLLGGILSTLTLIFFLRWGMLRLG